MADSERLIPPAPFSRVSLARFSHRLRRRGCAVGADGRDKENVAVAPTVRKRVKFDKRVYHGPVAVRGRPTAAAVRGILKRGRPADGRGGADDAVPNRMRMYDAPVTSFYIGAGEHLLLTAVKRPRTPRPPDGANKIRRFGTEIGSYLTSKRYPAARRDSTDV